MTVLPCVCAVFQACRRTCVGLCVEVGPLCGQLCTVNRGLCAHVCLRECESLVFCGCRLCVRVCVRLGVLSCPCWPLGSGSSVSLAAGAGGGAGTLLGPGALSWSKPAAFLFFFPPLGSCNGVETARGACVSVLLLLAASSVGLHLFGNGYVKGPRCERLPDGRTRRTSWAGGGCRARPREGPPREGGECVVCTCVHRWREGPARHVCLGVSLCRWRSSRYVAHRVCEHIWWEVGHRLWARGEGVQGLAEFSIRDVRWKRVPVPCSGGEWAVLLLG